MTAIEPLKVGFIGLGAMGIPMAQRIADAGFSLTVWNRDRGKAEQMHSAGIEVGDNPADVARKSDIVLLSLLNSEAVEAVILGPDGVAVGCSDGKARIIVDTSTTDPDVTRRIADRLANSSAARLLDVPVSGGVPGAEKGTLILFAGGDAELLDRARPVLASFSRRLTHMGGIGAGQTTKIFNQMIVAVNVMTIAETVALAMRSGVDASKLAPALEGGFADSIPLQLFAPRMAMGAFEPRQTGLNLMAKDLGFAEALGQSLDQPLPLVQAALSLYRAVGDRDDIAHDADVSALVRLYDKPPGD